MIGDRSSADDLRRIFTMCGDARGIEVSFDGCSGAVSVAPFFEVVTAVAGGGFIVTAESFVPGETVGAGLGGLASCESRFFAPEKRFAPPNKATIPETPPLPPANAGLFGPVLWCGGGVDEACGLGDSRPPNSDLSERERIRPN